MSDKTLVKVIAIIGLLILLWYGNVQSRKNQANQSYEERQQNIEELTDTNCSGPYCY